MSLAVSSITSNRMLSKVPWIYIKVCVIMFLRFKVLYFSYTSLCKVVPVVFYYDRHVEASVERYQIVIFFMAFRRNEVRQIDL